jgi:WD40 repeat protein
MFARSPAATRRAVATAIAALALLALLAPAGASAHQRATRDVIFAGNNWDGTATVIDPRKHFQPVATLNIIPDIDERMLEIAMDPERLAYFLIVRQLIGEGHDQFVDDMYSTPNGKLLIVSRPSLADVVAIRLKTGNIAWRFQMEGQRSDHMGLSPDGKSVAVSDSTANVVHVLDTRSGKELWQFPSGDSPHENTFSKDGSLIFHASIGRVYTPTENPEVNTEKGDRRFEIVSTKTHQIVKQLDMGEKLEEAGYPGMSSAVRPMALSPNEKWLYFQVSFFHGFVEYNLKRDRVRRVAQLPNLVPNMPREQYVLNSAHHGIAMSGDGKTLCVAGTMDDYAAMVDRRSLRYKLLFKGEKPYWATTSRNGKWCLLSWSGTDHVSIFSYAKKKEIASVPVGDHPQRVRMGAVRIAWLRAQG